MIIKKFGIFLFIVVIILNITGCNHIPCNYLKEKKDNNVFYVTYNEEKDINNKLTWDQLFKYIIKELGNKKNRNKSSLKAIVITIPSSFKSNLIIDLIAQANKSSEWPSTFANVNFISDEPNLDDKSSINKCFVEFFKRTYFFEKFENDINNSSGLRIRDVRVERISTIDSSRLKKESVNISLKLAKEYYPSGIDQLWIYF